MSKKRKYINAKVIKINNIIENLKHTTDNKSHLLGLGPKHQSYNNQYCNYTVEDELHWNFEGQKSYDEWYDFFVIVEYTVDGITYTKNIQIQREYNDINIGDQIEISYKMDNPESIAVSYKDLYKTETWMVKILLTLLIVYTIIFILIQCMGN